jgi:hypothetical protein
MVIRTLIISIRTLLFDLKSLFLIFTLDEYTGLVTYCLLAGISL